MIEAFATHEFNLELSTHQDTDQPTLGDLFRWAEACVPQLSTLMEVLNTLPIPDSDVPPKKVWIQ
jgi:hypothetical protein